MNQVAVYFVLGIIAFAFLFTAFWVGVTMGDHWGHLGCLAILSEHGVVL